MKILLRSTIVDGPTDNAEYAHRNYLALYESRLGFDTIQDTPIWEQIVTFTQAHNHVPSANTLREYFRSIGEDTVVDRLEIVLQETPIYRGDFLRRLEEKAEERRITLMRETLREAATVLTTGVPLKEGKETRILRGPHDAAKFLMDRCHDIVSPTTGGQMSGEVTRDGVAAWEDYERVKADPLAGIGQFTGYHQIDASLKGAKRHQLWTHAAFTGHGKSTFSQNWAYNQAVYAGQDSLIFSLEMSYKQCRASFYAMHSLHEDLETIRLQMGIQTHPNITTGLAYEDIVDGTLHKRGPNHERFFREHVIPHFEREEHGKIHIEVTDPNLDVYTVADLRQKAELLYAKSPYSMIIVDHALLLAPRIRMGSTTENLNQVMRDLKRLSMSFNRGQGMAVVCLFQISREGFKAASKNGGLYTLDHLSYSNEAERSSDIVTTSWAPDDVRSMERIQFQCLKSRDRAPFAPFSTRCEWHNHRIYDVDVQTVTPDAKKKQGDKFDGLLE